jgi:hypothetical protein
MSEFENRIRMRRSKVARIKIKRQTVQFSRRQFQEITEPFSEKRRNNKVAKQNIKDNF